MANIVFPDSSSPLFNPAAYGEASAEARKAKTALGKTKKTEETKNSFVSFFEKTVLGKLKDLPQSEESLHELLDEIHNTGETLSRRPYIAEISAYRAAVRNFINYVVKNSFDLEEQMSGTNVLKRKKFTLVQVIDTKLEGLAASILRGQINQLEILEKLDEIKGLLVDLLE